jgi:hypothetical protein
LSLGESKKHHLDLKIWYENLSSEKKICAKENSFLYQAEYVNKDFADISENVYVPNPKFIFGYSLPYQIDIKKVECFLLAICFKLPIYTSISTNSVYKYAPKIQVNAVREDLVEQAKIVEKEGTYVCENRNLLLPCEVFPNIVDTQNTSVEYENFRNEQYRCGIFGEQARSYIAYIPVYILPQKDLAIIYTQFWVGKKCQLWEKHMEKFQSEKNYPLGITYNVFGDKKDDSVEAELLYDVCGDVELVQGLLKLIKPLVRFQTSSRNSLLQILQERLDEWIEDEMPKGIDGTVRKWIISKVRENGKLESILLEQILPILRKK